MVGLWRRASAPIPTNIPSESEVIYLHERPLTSITSSTFKTRQEPLPKPNDLPTDMVLIRVLYISVDPAMRGWLSTRRSYIPPVKLNAVMRANGVGEVVYSTGNIRQGELVTGMFGWRDYIALPISKINRVRLPSSLAKQPSIILGVLGLTGLTAYFGLLRVGLPQKGNIVVVSAAAGATGSVVAQIAKNVCGCRVIGIAGGKEKCTYLKEELCIEAVDYKAEEGVFEGLQRELNGEGIDVYFDNVGGETLEAALGLLNLNARVVICGAISQYNTQDLKGPKNYMKLLVKRATMSGFLCYDYENSFTSARNDIGKWIQKGWIKTREHEIIGLENAPNALAALFKGENIGKIVVKVGDRNNGKLEMRAKL